MQYHWKGCPWVRDWQKNNTLHSWHPLYHVPQTRSLLWNLNRLVSSLLGIKMKYFGGEGRGALNVNDEGTQRCCNCWQFENQNWQLWCLWATPSHSKRIQRMSGNWCCPESAGDNSGRKEEEEKVVVALLYDSSIAYILLFTFSLLLLLFLYLYCFIFS